MTGDRRNRINLPEFEKAVEGHKGREEVVVIPSFFLGYKYNAPTVISSKV